MMAVFKCPDCGTEALRGYFKGKNSSYEFPCIKCLKMTAHIFSRHVHVDDRTEAQRMRDRLGVKKVTARYDGPSWTLEQDND